jgi:hypothetical protein
MSQTIWLEPSSEKTVYIQVRNTSDKDMSNLQTLIANDLSAKGYKVTNSSDTAYFWVQANVLKADKMDLRQTQGFLSSGYEGAATGAHWGRVLPPITPALRAPRWALGWLPVWWVLAADAMVEDVNFTMVTDLQISERSKAPVTTECGCA